MDTLLHVDDDPMQRVWINHLFCDTFNIVSYEDAESVLRDIEQLHPSVAILDLELPNMNGYQLCEKMRENYHLNDCLILILSAHDDIQDRLNAYEAGADDYFTKPAIPEELLAKVNRLHTLSCARKEAEDYAIQSQQTSFSALSALGETDITLNFFKKISFCDTQKKLLHISLKALTQFGLSASIEIRLIDGIEEHHASPIERSVLEHMRNMGQLFEFKKQVVFNSERVTILVRNMPIEDIDRYNRIKEHVSQIVEGLEIAVSRIEANELVNKQANALAETKKELLEASSDLQRELRSLRQQGDQNMYEMTESLHSLIMCYDLKETQELAIREIMERARENLFNLQSQELGIEKVIGKLLEKLS